MRINYPSYSKDKLDVVRPGFWMKTDRWPWQPRGSRALMTSEKEANMDRWGWGETDGTGRFGGGWNWKLGVSIGRLLPGTHGWSVHFDLLFGMVSVGFRSRYATEQDNKSARERYERNHGPVLLAVEQGKNILADF